jgi:hypothetical protein
MIDLSLSSDEENFIDDTSHDVEFDRKLFYDLNCSIIGPPGDGKTIILDDSNEEKEAPDDKTADTELTTTSTVVNPVPTASAVADDAPEGAKNDNSDDQGPIMRPVATTTMEVVTVRLRTPRQRPRC